MITSASNCYSNKIDQSINQSISAGNNSIQLELVYMCTNHGYYCCYRVIIIYAYYCCCLLDYP